MGSPTVAGPYCSLRNPIRLLGGDEESKWLRGEAGGWEKLKSEVKGR